ncbi:MAG TPA: hypothetical protein VMU77_01495, partial [Acidimicrobiales bacterium]|nr:hypothetical protein [Acidimicrobiales bacterium]
LLISLETMIPGQRRMALGIEIVTTLTLWFGMWFRVATRSRRELGGIPDLAKRRLPFSYTFFMLMFVGGIGLFTHSMGGLYLVAPGDVLCMLIAVQNAWFFLTEIGIDEEEEIKEEKAELDMIRDAVEEREAKSN